MFIVRGARVIALRQEGDVYSKRCERVISLRQEGHVYSKRRESFRPPSRHEGHVILALGFTIDMALLTEGENFRTSYYKHDPPGGGRRIDNISHDFYSGGRHEMLNEINRDEVRARLLGWIST